MTADLQDDRWAIPVLRRRPGGFAERFAGSLGRTHPIVVFLAAILAGFAAIAGLSIAIGFLVTRVLVHAWGLGAADERVEVWLAAHRAPWRTDASLIGSIMAGGVVLPLLAGRSWSSVSCCESGGSRPSSSSCWPSSLRRIVPPRSSSIDIGRASRASSIFR